RVTDNPLAAPGVLGLNAGAGFFVILTLAVAPSAHLLLPFSAFAGAMLAALLILSLSARFGFDKLTLMLGGVALSALFGAGISFISVLDTDALASYTDFSVGGLQYVFLSDLALPAPIIGVCFVGALLLSRRLQLFCLGDSLAVSLGVNVKRVRLLALILAAASAAAAVSFAGLLGYVGLLVPHITRRLTRNSARRELLLSPIGGAILLTGADLAGRLLFAPSELPVGILTALLGVPFFLILLLGRKHHA
ncbi:MAG: iron ABC transporter permease, partial [Clostridia bacterium]|nr:iron ABC transporter permease [Clostridia bacterium]